MEQPSSLPPEQSKDEPADKIGFRSRLLRWGIVLAVAAGILLIPVPSGITPQSWRLLAIFAATITGIHCSTNSRRRGRFIWRHCAACFQSADDQ